MVFKLRSAYSDHSLFKPSFTHFIDMWNTDEKALLEELDVESLYHHSSKDSFDLLESAQSEADLRELRRQEKRARRERRRNSVLINNRKAFEVEHFSRVRAASDPDIRPVQSTSRNDKRVAFALEPLSLLSNRFLDATLPQVPSTKPILVRKRRVSCIPPQDSLMDYETFAAWRRGSKLSIDVTMHDEIMAAQAKLRAKLEAERKRKSLVSSFADVLKQCFIHRTARTSPVGWMQA